ncbi:MAG: IS200/IS605 family transposase [Ignavibacteria bacterium]
MSYIKIWIHLIWSTKNREKLINPVLKTKLLNHIRENAKEKNIYVDSMNCLEEHIHLLISLKGDQSISKVSQFIKGESSHWINKNNLTKIKFEWQDEYIAISVSESVVQKVRDYIKNQEEHHRIKSFNEEYKQFMKRYGFDKLTQIYPAREI